MNRTSRPARSSLEGLIAARIIVKALKGGRVCAREALIRAIEGMRDISVGGFLVFYFADSHSASHFVELTVLNRDGQVRY